MDEDLDLHLDDEVEEQPDGDPLLHAPSKWRRLCMRIPIAILIAFLAALSFSVIEQDPILIQEAGSSSTDSNGSSAETLPDISVVFTDAQYDEVIRRIEGLNATVDTLKSRVLELEIPVGVEDSLTNIEIVILELNDRI